MKGINKILIGLSLIVWGLLSLLDYFLLVDFQPNTIITITLIFYGLTTVYFNFGSGNRGYLFAGTFLFLVGILLYTTSTYDLISANKLFLFSFLFIIGSSFLMLTLENLKEKTFAFAGGLMLLLSIALMPVEGFNDYFVFLNRITMAFVSYLPFFLIIFGIIFWVSRRGNK